MPPDGADPAAKCPVDHTTREKWLEAAKARRELPPGHPPLPDAAPTAARATRFSLDTMSWQPVTPAVPSHASRVPGGTPKMYCLSSDREISTIPRAGAATSDHIPSTAESAATASSPANSEADTGHDTETGNWVYPSQEMFFSAMKRKGHVPQAEDMAAIVPIHNAVNERAWAEIKQWEKGRGSEKCGGPRLVSFSGESKKLTPRARWNSWVMGYQEPFDRHDWVVDRCGKHIDYVIDFYSGKDQGLAGKSLNFYLDVRPKLNGWEGVKMRAEKILGL